MTETTAMDELRRLINTQGGVIEPEDVVRSARPKRSPLHKSFEWDDAVAGPLYRLDQARALLRKVTVERVVGGETVRLRAVVSIANDRGGETYHTIDSVAMDDDLRRRFEEQLEREWRTFRSKWNNHRDYLAAVVRRDLLDGAA
jgi:hypothetical protein